MAALYKRCDRSAQAGLGPRPASSRGIRAPGERQVEAGGVGSVTKVSGTLPQEPRVRGESLRMSLLVWWQSGVSLAGGATAAVGAFQDRTLVSLPVGVVMSALGIAATTTGGALVYFDHTS